MQLNDQIFFLECKKKFLTNAARGGNVLAASVDFAQALLAPLIQINRHETQLRVGGLEFENGLRLLLNGRQIQRVAITMTDHGSMQDRMFIRAVLGGLWGATLTAIDTEHRDSVDKVNDKLQGFDDSISVLAAQVGGEFDRFFSEYLVSIIWLSIDQLTFLCERTRDLRRATNPVGRVVFGTGDLMSEIAHCDRMGLLKDIARKSN